MSIDSATVALAARQCGLITRAQLSGLGTTKRQVLLRMERGEWDRLGSKLVHIPGLSEDEWLKRCWAGVLTGGAGAGIGHAAAGRLFGWQACSGASPSVLVRHPRHVTVEAVRIRQSRTLMPSDLTERSGAPVVMAARTILDLSMDFAPPRLEACLDDALASEQCTLGSVGRQLHRVMRTPRRGLRNVAVLLDERSTFGGHTDSAGEQRLADAFARHGGPSPKTQFRYPTAGREGRVDFAFPRQRILVEVDNRRWHSRVQDLRRDHDRDLEAAKLGWLTIRLQTEDIAMDADDAVASVMQVVATRS